MNKAVFCTIENNLIITLISGEVIKKTFASKQLFSADKAGKIALLKKYIIGFLKLNNVFLKLK